MDGMAFHLTVLQSVKISSCMFQCSALLMNNFCLCYVLLLSTDSLLSSTLIPSWKAKRIRDAMAVRLNSEDSIKRNSLECEVIYPINSECCFIVLQLLLVTVSGKEKRKLILCSISFFNLCYCHSVLVDCLFYNSEFERILFIVFV